MCKTCKKHETKEQTSADSSGSVESSMEKPILKKDLYKKQGEFKEATDASSSGSFSDVPAFGNNTKGGGRKKNPLKIDGVKSIANSRSVKDKNFPKWGGPDSVFVQVNDKCKKFPYCNQGDLNTIKPLKEAIEQTAKKYGLTFYQVEELVLNEIKQIFI